MKPWRHFWRGLLLMMVVNGRSGAAETGASASLDWQPLPDLPVAAGLKGMYGGVHGGRVMLAGGSNFPVPPRAGGKKAFHRNIYVRAVDAGAEDGWARSRTELPADLGEGASVSTGDGMLAMGGHNGTGPVASVFRLRWDETGKRIEIDALTALPEPRANGAAAVLEGSVYLAGGEGPAGTAGDFWRCDLARLAAGGGRWERVPSPPARPRTGGVLGGVQTARGAALLWGGGVHAPARSQADYLRDTWLFDPRTGIWRPGAQLARGTVLGAVIAPAPDRLLVLGGSDGHDFERMRELGVAYRIPADGQWYDGRSDRWTTRGTMPQGLAGAAVIALGNRWMIAGGEPSPGQRTPRVCELRIQEP